jgi:2-polyprenyl-3-methyl-5-hydroxy-6-metoxy-1,4-benzoquinol methylase
MVYASPVAASLATGEFYDQLATPFYLSPDKLAGDYAPVRFARELKLFRRFCQRGSVLDVGCSTGAFLHQLQTRFPGEHEVTGIDVAGPALDHAEKMGVRVLRESFLTADFQGRTFAAITFWAVMEHLVHPREFLARAASLLQPGGWCFILVPNFRSVAVRVLGAKYRYVIPQHVNYFTPATLRRLAEQEPSLNLVQAGSMHFNPLVILRDWKSDGRFVPDAERAELLKRTTGYKQNPALRPVKLALAGIEKVLGWSSLADNIVLVLRKDGSDTKD